MTESKHNYDIGEHFAVYMVVGMRMSKRKNGLHKYDYLARCAVCGNEKWVSRSFLPKAVANNTKHCRKCYVENKKHRRKVVYVRPDPLSRWSEAERLAYCGRW